MNLILPALLAFVPTHVQAVAPSSAVAVGSPAIRSGPPAKPAPAPPAEGPRTLDLAGPVHGLDVCDVNGDGVRELVIGTDTGIEVRAHNGELLETIPRGERRTLGFCCVHRQQGAEDILLLVDGGRVLRHREGVTEDEPIVHDPGVLLPAGVYPVPFAREFRRPGQIDLVLPHRDGLKLFLGDETGFRPGPHIRHRPGTFLNLPWNRTLPGNLSQDVRLPAFQWFDQNGDGHPDLRFQDQDLLQCFWTDANGNLPERPTLELDLEELRSRLGVDTEVFDTSNLFKGLQGMVTQEMRDLDDDGRDDLLLRQGSKVTLHRGTPDGVDRSEARQVLKVSGNLLAVFSADENGDGRLDLGLLQIQKVSLAEILLWVVIGGDLELELFTYHQIEPLRFSKRPSARRVLTVEIPPLRNADEVFEEPTKEFRAQMRTIPVPLDWDGDGRRDDAALLANDGSVAVHLDLTDQEIPRSRGQAWQATLDTYDREDDGDHSLTVTFQDLMGWIPMYGRELIAGAKGKTPVATLPALASPPDPEGEGAVLLFRVDLDRNGGDDLVRLSYERRHGPAQVIFWSAR